MRISRNVACFGGIALSFMPVAACAIDGGSPASDVGTNSLAIAAMPPDGGKDPPEPTPVPPPAPPPTPTPAPPPAPQVICQTAPLRTHVPTDLAAAYGVNATTSIDVFPSEGDVFGPSRAFVTQQGGFTADDKFVAGDFDGDGVTDLATVWNNGGNSTVAIRASNGSRFTVRQGLDTIIPFAKSTKWLAGDFDGDGKDDLAAAFHDGPGTSIAVFVSTGPAFKGPYAWTTQNGGWSDDDRWVVGDFDGDHHADIATIWNDNGQNAIAIRYSRQNLITVGDFIAASGGTQKGPWLSSTKWFAGDFDGDGHSEIAAVWNDGGFVSISVLHKPAERYALFDGGHAWATRDGGWSDRDGWTVGDFDGNGWTDLAGVWNDRGYRTVAVRLSTGGAFRTQERAFHDGLFDPTTSYCAGHFVY